MDCVGEAQHAIADSCMRDNMSQEIALSKNKGMSTATDPTGLLRQGIAASVDMGWQKRSSGRRYDSPSGIALMIGALSKKILQRHVCSTLCRVCANHSKQYKQIKESEETVPPAREHRCPRNYEGTSKGMEATVAVLLVKVFFDDTKRLKDCPPAFIDIVISDDDSSTWAYLQQSLTQRLDRENEKNALLGLPSVTMNNCAFWPKDGNGKAKKDKGQLSVDELAPRFNFADFNHRTKVLGKHLYPLTNNRKDSGKQLSKPMCKRLKLHFGKALHDYRRGTCEELRNGLMATLEHEFNNHEHCSATWCKFLQAKDDQDRSLLANRWKNKTVERVLYDTLLAVYETFLTPERIVQMHHSFDTQM